MSLKNPVTPPGIDPGTVRLVAQRLNHYTTPDPFLIHIGVKNTTIKVRNNQDVMQFNGLSSDLF